MNKPLLTENGLNLYYDSNCIICGNVVPSKIIGAVTEHEYDTTDFTFKINLCMNCSLVSLYPRLDYTSFETIYPKDYYTNHYIMRSNENPCSSKLLKYFYKKNLKSFYTKLKPLLKNKLNEIKILDIGCGVGNHLDIFKEIFPNSVTSGVEPNEKAAAIAIEKGHNIFIESFEDLKSQSNEYDLIYSSHVIEHVEDPILFMKKCSVLTKSNGYILIETPNTDCIDFKLFKRGTWGGYHTPRHWYLFNTENFQLLSQKVNLKIDTYKCYCAPIFWSWTAHSLCIKLINRKFADLCFPPVKIFYGGFQAFVILGFFSVLERLIFFLTKRANCFYILLKK